MDRFKFVALFMLPLLVSLAPSPWFMLSQNKFTATQRGTIYNARINECSGIAMSRSAKDALWLHNDSGDAARLYLVGLDGTTRSTAEIAGATALDWEDMCSFSLDDRNWVLIADTGDNQKNRATRRERAKLYLVEEPKQTRKAARLQVKRTIEFEYEDGPHDCEGIAVDTASRTILLITKSLLPTSCHLYSLPLEPTKKTPIAKKIADLPLPVVTGMDLSPNGRKLVVITPRLGFMVTRKGNEKWTKAVSRSPVAFQLPIAPQIEAVCFDPNGDSLFVISEGMNQPIWQLKPSKPKS